jgi:hypothetical protein
MYLQYTTNSFLQNEKPVRERVEIVIAIPSCSFTLPASMEILFHFSLPLPDTIRGNDSHQNEMFWEILINERMPSHQP